MKKVKKFTCSSTKLKAFLDQNNFEYTVDTPGIKEIVTAKRGAVRLINAVSPYHPEIDKARIVTLSSADNDVFPCPIEMNASEKSQSIIDAFIQHVEMAIKRDDAKRLKLQNIEDRLDKILTKNGGFFETRFAEDNTLSFEISGVPVFTLHNTSSDETYLSTFGPDFVRVQLARANSIMPIIRENAIMLPFTMNETGDGIYVQHIFPMLKHVMHLDIGVINVLKTETFRSCIDTRFRALMQDSERREETFYELVFNRAFRVTATNKFEVQEAVTKNV